jgi:hypothetical protein
MGRVAAPTPASAADHRADGCNAHLGGAAIGNSGHPRYASTFVAAKGGKLSRLVFRIDKKRGTRGDFVA